MNVRIANISAKGLWMSPPPRRPGRPELPTDQNSAGGRLRALRKGARLSQDELAEQLHITRPMISKYENNEHEMPDHIIERASQAFGVTPSFLRYGDVQSRMAPVRGYVGAGARVEAIDQGPSSYVEVPASWSDAMVLEVRGTSCYPIYEDGDHIVIRGEHRLIESEMLNRMCVVETADGIGLVKRVRRGSSPGLYTLESPNAPPLEDVHLVSARPVKLHLQR